MIVSGTSARIDLTPFSSDELHNLGVGVASTAGKLSSSAGSFYTFEPRVNITLWCTAFGEKDELNIKFDGYGPEPAPPSKDTTADEEKEKY